MCCSPYWKAQKAKESKEIAEEPGMPYIDWGDGPYESGFRMDKIDEE